MFKAAAMSEYNSMLVSNKWLAVTASGSSYFQTGFVTDTKKGGKSPAGTGLGVGTNDSLVPKKFQWMDRNAPEQGKSHTHPHPNKSEVEQHRCSDCFNGLPGGKERWGNHLTGGHDPNGSKNCGGQRWGMGTTGNSPPAATNAATIPLST
jgi:hypothetical protein